MKISPKTYEFICEGMFIAYDMFCFNKGRPSKKIMLEADKVLIELGGIFIEQGVYKFKCNKDSEHPPSVMAKCLLEEHKKREGFFEYCEKNKYTSNIRNYHEEILLEKFIFILQCEPSKIYS